MIKYFQILLASFIEWVTFTKLPPKLLNGIIRLYVKHYQIQLDEFDCDESQITCFNDFFTRKLKPDTRAIGKGIVSPVDATIYASGQVISGQIVQVKSQKISLKALLDDDEFSANYYMSLHLSPADYHRFHAPTDLKINSIKHIPGMFYSVRPKIAKKRKVFLKNERVIVNCDTNFGKVYLIFIAAQNVGKIEIKALGGICPSGKTISLFNNFKQAEFQKGEELGAFHMGSSVVILTENAKLASSINKPIKMGETIEQA